MGNGVDLSVVVPTYSRAGSVRRLLDALSQQTLDSGRFEVIIAIDGSRDGTLELVTEYRAPYELASTWQENSGRARARRCGGRNVHAIATAPRPMPDDAANSQT